MENNVASVASKSFILHQHFSTRMICKKNNKITKTLSYIVAKLLVNWRWNSSSHLARLWQINEHRNSLIFLHFRWDHKWKVSIWKGSQTWWLPNVLFVTKLNNSSLRYLPNGNFLFKCMECIIIFSETFVWIVQQLKIFHIFQTYIVLCWICFEKWNDKNRKVIRNAIVTWKCKWKCTFDVHDSKLAIEWIL